MSGAQTGSDSRYRAIRIWLMVVAALVFAVAAVGGATRVTGSGLSIVEWRPVTGTIPPLSENAWQAEFEKYKTIPQYRELNRGMSLDEFKVIYWWEWTHRLLGRLIGVVFLLPFLFFLWKGWIERSLRLRLWTIFGLGAVQGAVGWWMVSSGLAERVSVSHYRLAFHLTLACVIFAMVLWTAQQLKPRAPLVVPARLRVGATVLLVLVLAQIYLGALVAGLRAGLIYNTWPLDRRSAHSRCRAAVVRAALVAQPFRQSAHGAVQPPHDGLCDLCAGDPARGRRRTHGKGRDGIDGGARACLRRHHSGRDRRADAHSRHAAAAGAAASGDGSGDAGGRRAACGALERAQVQAPTFAKTALSS